jgi:AhpD family alkylhydroperoxidase
MFKATMDDAPLPKILKWKVAEVVSNLNECAFCLDVTHSQLKQFGLSNEQIEKIEETDDQKEKIAMEFAKAATKEAYKIDPEIIGKIKENFNDSELVELAAVIGLFNYINRFNDSLGVLPV